LGAPILLDAGHSYVIGATYVHMDSDRIGLSRTWENASPVYNSAVSFNVIRFGDSVSELTFPDLLGFPDVELGQFGPNAEFSIVPEPSASVLLCFSLVCLFLVRRCLQRHTAEPDAPPNGGPATRLGNSGATEGPPAKS
jgi:hypothetical protein